jgi:hypothetical protein
MANIRFLDQVPLGVYGSNNNTTSSEGGVTVASASVDLGIATTLNFTGSSISSISVVDDEAIIEVSYTQFPFSGSAIITGSLIVSGSTNISGSVTINPITNATGSILNISPSGVLQQRTQAQTILDINGISNATDTFVSTSKVLDIVTLTQAEYDALSPTSTTLYIII